eukprot:5342947-Prymnesium_polylepis.1
MVNASNHQALQILETMPLHAFWRKFYDVRIPPVRRKDGAPSGHTGRHVSPDASVRHSRTHARKNDILQACWVCA